MLGSVLLKGLRDARRGFTWWSVGLVAYVAILAAAYPTVRDNPALNKFVNDYPEAVRGFIAFGGEVDYLSPAGYLGSEAFSFMLPLLLLIAAVGNGAGALAGEEERGTLDLLLSLPLSRRRVAAEKLAALAVEVAGLGLVLWLALLAAASAAGMHLPAARLGAATLSAVLLALAYGALAFLLGAASGRRGRAIGVSAALAVAAYLVNSLAPLVSALEPVQKVSPFYHYGAGDPLRQGLHPWHALVLAGLALALALLALPAFHRRDLAA